MQLSQQVQPTLFTRRAVSTLKLAGTVNTVKSRVLVPSFVAATINSQSPAVPCCTRKATVKTTTSSITVERPAKTAPGWSGKRVLFLPICIFSVSTVE